MAHYFASRGWTTRAHRPLPGPELLWPSYDSGEPDGRGSICHAAKIYSARPEADLRAYGNNVARAKRAWDCATANPSVLYYNNDDTKQPGSRGLASGQQEMNDAERLFAKFGAAVYLYELMSDVSYKQFVESNYTSIIASDGPTQEDADKQEALLYYTRLADISAQAKSRIVTKFVANITSNADQLPMVTNNKDPYRSPIKDYTWGSNQSKLLQARLYQLLRLY
jgi:endoglucanase